VVGGYEDLLVWQKAKDLAVAVYRTTEEGRWSRDFGLRDQMTRSGVSVPSNIAEGDERATDKEAVHFFTIAKGSLAELRTQVQIAYEIGCLDEQSAALRDRCTEIAKMLGSLIKARSKPR
jgi:four helix bundle protein